MKRLHLLSVPHAVTHRDYSTCAFSQKVLKFGKMMKGRGYELVHYGHSDSALDCDEHVTVTTNEDLERSYPGFDWRKDGFHPYKLEDQIYQTFYANTISEVGKRKQPGDFLLCFFGHGHKPVADAHPDMIVVEPGIGYSGGTFAPYKVYESYAAMHALYGRERLASMFNDGWYDAVVPNYFDLDDFTFSAEKDDYFLFLGRIGPGKGFHIASELVQRIGGKLVVAGPGAVDPAPHLIQIGVVGPVERARLLSRAKATICASMYLEPFCGVQVESMLSGTPVISTDWGAFCVPLEAEILTGRGWLKHSDVRIGQDYTLGYDPTLKRNRWTMITAVNRFDQRPTIEWSNRTTTVRTTKEHRWAAIQGRGQNDVLAPISAVGNSPDRLRLSAEAEGGNLPITPQESAIIAWLLTDGSIETRMVDLKRRSFDPETDSSERIGKPRIWQSKPKGIQAIRELLVDVPHTETDRSFEGNQLPRRVFRLDPSFVRAIFLKANINEIGFCGFLTGLTQSARKSFLQACVDAEGWTVDDCCTMIAQNEGHFADAIALCAYLCGYRPMINTKGIYKGIKNISITLGKPLIIPKYIRVSEKILTEDVWCPTTVLGTWTMRMNGHILLTGNSEVNLHGVTGYRCRTMEQFEWAAKNIDRINPKACRDWAADNFSLERVARMYDEFFHAVAQIHGGAGWYQPNPGRRELDWLRQRHPFEWNT